MFVVCVLLLVVAADDDAATAIGGAQNVFTAGVRRLYLHHAKMAAAIPTQHKMGSKMLMITPVAEPPLDGGYVGIGVGEIVVFIASVMIACVVRNE